jgi:hypothetical protein
MVRQVKNKRAVTLVVSAPTGVEEALRLVRGKLRTQHRFEQAVSRVINHEKFVKLRNEAPFTQNTSSSLENY